MSLGSQDAPRSILASGTSFREDLVMKLFLRPFLLFRSFMKSSCQLMAKGCALSTGCLPRGGLPRNSVDRITDRPDMTSSVDHRRKASNKKNNQPLVATLRDRVMMGKTVSPPTAELAALERLKKIPDVSHFSPLFLIRSFSCL